MYQNQKSEQLAADIRRTLILGAYIHFWGMPDCRIISSDCDNIVEIYSFPPKENEKIHRIATIGISSILERNSKTFFYELFMALPSDLGEASFFQIASFLMDIFIYSLRDDVRFSTGSVIPETSLMPSSWKPRAILLDEPRAEPEELCSFQIGSQQVDLIWVIPIYKNEYDLIINTGIETFDAACEQAEWSLADIWRPSFVALPEFEWVR